MLDLDVEKAMLALLSSPPTVDPLDREIVRAFTEDRQLVRPERRTDEAGER